MDRSALFDSGALPALLRRRDRRHGMGAGKPGFRCHPRPIGDGDYGREYPRQTGMTSGGDRKTRNARNATDTLTNHAEMTPVRYRAQRVPRTWAQTAIMPRNKAMEVSAAASSTTARNMMPS